MRLMGTDLTVEGICQVIRACKESGVWHFQFGQLNIEFRHTEVHASELDTAPQEKTVSLPPASPEEEKKSFLRQEMEAKAESLAQKIIEDPLGYEELLMRGELSLEKDGLVGAEA